MLMVGFNSFFDYKCDEIVYNLVELELLFLFCRKEKGGLESRGKLFNYIVIIL